VKPDANYAPGISAQTTGHCRERLFFTPVRAARVSSAISSPALDNR